jgi:uncharacterized glyoxalase superfamily protein PhnB
MPVTSLHPYLSYRDAHTAIAWLDRALGFTCSMRWEDADGLVAHAELRRDGAAVVVFADAGVGYDRAAPRGETVGQGTYLTVAAPHEVDAVWERALAAEAVAVWAPAWTEWGNYRCRVRDPEGYEWTFGVHRPGVDEASGQAW